MKKCFQCREEKNIDCFYKHPDMPDGHVNKCKECTKKNVKENRLSRIEYYRQYDRDRGNRQGYQYVKETREKFPKKYKAHSMINSAVRSGKMKKADICEKCSSTFSIHAHHDDYNFPLTVRWLCASCHNAWHRINGEGLNAR